MPTLRPDHSESEPEIHVALVPGPVEPHGDSPVGPDAGGGTCIFVGTTRPERHPDHGELLELEYDAAEPLASERLRNLARDIAESHHLRQLSIEHARGSVPVGRASVRIIAIADHRDPAFTACREAIDRLKREIPIWKRERWRSGTTWSTATSPLAESASEETT